MKDNDSLYQPKIINMEKQTVVGLSDHHVYQLAEFLSIRLDKSSDYFYNRIQTWLKKQTFEKQIIEIPIGLTEKQIESLSLLLLVNDNFPTKREYGDVISEWCKSQQFKFKSDLTNPHDGDFISTNIDENTVISDEAVNAIFTEFSDLLDNNSSTKSDWSTAPHWAKYRVSDENGNWLWLDSDRCVRTKYKNTTEKKSIDNPINKVFNTLINFDDAPIWARWCAMDADGEWFWYQTKPTIGHNTWDSLNRCEKLEENHFLSGIWKSTLIENEKFDIRKNIEIDQIWIHNSMKFKVIEVDLSTITCLNDEGFIWSGSPTVFLEKFIIEGLEND